MRKSLRWFSLLSAFQERFPTNLFNNFFWIRKNQARYLQATLQVVLHKLEKVLRFGKSASFHYFIVLSVVNFLYKLVYLKRFARIQI